MEDLLECVCLMCASVRGEDRLFEKGWRASLDSCFVTEGL